MMAHLAAARAAWPSLVWDEAAYLHWLANAPDRPDDLSGLPAPEVVLCWACGRGDAVAQRLFEAHYMSEVAPALRRFGNDRALHDEVAQRVRVKLLMRPAPGELAAIARYAFSGRLAAVVRVAAVREALTLRRLEPPRGDEAALDGLASERDPALRALKQRYAVDFSRAFRAAVSELSAKDRQLLRLNLNGTGTIDDVARMYRTHRATAARWIASAREALAAGTRRQLQTMLGIGQDEVESVLRLLHTQAPRLLESIPGE
jgi:RNA polymerase sigma-70 factor (ECF subfamily)